MSSDRKGDRSRRTREEFGTGAGPCAAAPRPRRDPRRTKAAIVEAAVTEFAERGYGGGRVDSIVARAGVSQSMVYHYFADKAALYEAVLGHVHDAMRLAEAASDPSETDPVEGVAALVRGAWERHAARPAFVSILTSEDALLERQGAPDADGRRPGSPLVPRLGHLLRRGERSGAFRRGVDPLLLHVTISSLCLSYLSRKRTLSATYGRDLGTSPALATWGEHVVGVVLASLRP